MSEASERYQVPQRLRTVGDSARRGAHAAYRMALDHPKTSIASAIVAAAVVGGVRARTERRRSHARSSVRTAA